MSPFSTGNRGSTGPFSSLWNSKPNRSVPSMSGRSSTNDICSSTTELRSDQLVQPQTTVLYWVYSKAWCHTWCWKWQKETIHKLGYIQTTPLCVCGLRRFTLKHMMWLSECTGAVKSRKICICCHFVPGISGKIIKDVPLGSEIRHK